MPSGSGGQIAIFKVGSLYAEVNSVYAATSPGSAPGAQWTNFVSENIAHNLAELAEGSITGYKAAPPSHRGAENATGEVQLEPNPNALGPFLRGAFGQVTTTLLTEAGSWGANSGNALNTPAGYAGDRPVSRHRFNPRQSAFDDFCFLPPYGVMVYKDVGSAFFYGPCVFPSVEFAIQAGQLARATVNVLGRKISRAARTSSVSALRNPGGQPWVWDMSSIQFGPGVNSLAAYTNFEALTIRYEQPIEGVLLLDGTRAYGEYQANGFQSVAVNGTVSFRDHTAYDQFKDYNNNFLRVILTNTRSELVLGNPASAYFFELAIDIPLFKFLSWTTPIQGPNRLTTQFTGRAEFDTTSLYAIEVRLTNTTSGY